jgi:alpha-tubulin suppressor-like RCC1 family protein
MPVVTGYGLPASVDAIGCGAGFTCALAGGKVWCWGDAEANQLGNPSVPVNACINYCSLVPVPVQQTLPGGGNSQVPDGGADQYPLTGVTSLVVGYQFACALDASGSMRCWGAGTAGSMTVTQATVFTQTSPSVPSTGITKLTAHGEGFNDSPRYLTSAGVYVSASRIVTPSCP